MLLKQNPFSYRISVKNVATMKSLTPEQKMFLYGNMVYGRFWWIAKPIYDLVLGAELLFHRIEDLFFPKDHGDVSQLTAVIKTFERPYAVKRLVNSIRRQYPDLIIFVVDDSKEPNPLEGVNHIIMPYDTGISIGRNEALDQLESPYFLLLDDDFVFSHRQKLGELINYMERNQQVDILGGKCIDLPFYIKHAFHDMGLYKSATPKIAVGTMIDSHPVVN